MPDTVTVPSHIPVTNAMSEDPRPVPSLEPVDAAMFPSIEETHLAIPSRRVKVTRRIRLLERSNGDRCQEPPDPLPPPYLPRMLQGLMMTTVTFPFAHPG
jgi:hypothetical protein